MNCEVVWIRGSLNGEVLGAVVIQAVIELEMYLGELRTLRVRVRGDDLLIIGGGPKRVLFPGAEAR